MPKSFESILSTASVNVITPKDGDAPATNDTNTHLQQACESKTKLNALKKEQEAKLKKLAEDQIQLEEALQAKQVELKGAKKAEGGFLKRQVSSKGDARKGFESEAIKLQEQLDAKKLELKTYKTTSKDTLKEKEKAHEDIIITALSSVKKEKNLQDSNPLAAHQAAYIGDQVLFDQVNKSVRLDGKAKDENTVLHAAVLGGNKEVILKLAEKGADFGAQNEAGQTPIHLVAMNPSYNSKTTMEWAKGKEATHRDIDNIKEVIPEMSPALDIPDKQGKTALHYAAENGDEKTVEALIKAGADPNALDSKGKSPLDYVPEKAEEVKDAFTTAVPEYADRQFALANIGGLEAKKNTTSHELDENREKLRLAKKAVIEARNDIDATKVELAKVKKKQGYIEDIERLKLEHSAVRTTTRKEEVNVANKENLKADLVDQKQALKRAQDVMANRNRVTKATKQLLTDIEAKKNYPEEIEELTRRINAGGKDVHKLTRQKEDLEKKLLDGVKLDQEEDLRRNLTTLEGAEDVEDSLNKAQKEEREKQEAVNLTQEKLAAIGQQVKLQKQIDALGKKRDAIVVDVSDKEPKTLKGKEARLSAKHKMLEGDEDVEGSLKKAEKEKRDLDAEIKRQTSELKAENKEIDRINAILEGSPKLKEEAGPRALNAAIAAGDKEGIVAALKPLVDTANKDTDEYRARLAKYNVADNAGRTPLSYAMEKGLHEEMKEIIDPLKAAYESAHAEHATKRNESNQALQLHEESALEIKQLEEEFLEAKKTENLAKFEGHSTKEDQLQFIEQELTDKRYTYTNNQVQLDQKIATLKEKEEELAAATKAYNPPDKNGRTPLSYAMEKGLHEEMKVITTPLKKAFEEARKSYYHQTNSTNNTIESHKRQVEEIKKLKQEFEEAKKDENKDVHTTYTTKAEQLKALESALKTKTKAKDDHKKAAEKAIADLEQAERDLDIARQALNPKDVNGKTDLDYAIAGNNEKGAALYDHTTLHMQAANKEVDLPDDITKVQTNAPNINGETPVHVAVKNGNKAGVEKLLLVEDVDLSLRDIEGNTPLHVAANIQTPEGKELTAKLIEGASPEVLDTANKDGNTLLHLAARNSDVELMTALSKKEISTTLKNNKGHNFIDVALGHKDNDPKFIKAFTKGLKEKTGINFHPEKMFEDKEGKARLELAVKAGNDKILEALIEEGAVVPPGKLAEAKKRRAELDEIAKEEEKKRQAEIAAAEKGGLTAEEKAKMAGSAPTKDGERSDASQDHVGKVWKEENFKDDKGVKTCTIGDTSQGHFKQTRTADGKFEYEVANTGVDEEDRIQVLKVPREGSNPKSFDVVKFNKAGNVVDYQEGKGGSSKIGPETMKKVNAHVESLSRAEVSSEKAKPRVVEGQEIETPPPPPVKKKNSMEIPEFDPNKEKDKKLADKKRRVAEMRKNLAIGRTTLGGGFSPPSTARGKAVKTEKGSYEI